MVAIQKLKVQYHTRGDPRSGFSDVLLSSRGTHGISVGDLIEVYHPDDVHHGLFLVTTLRDDVQTRDIISIEHSLAQYFRLQQHKTVCVRIVDKETVTLDLVELHFREQYISRSDCYRITQELLGSVVQGSKKLDVTDFRLQVGELWRRGEKYSCGYVGPRTKVVFRSSSASVHVFIQLSEEMWLFDDHGDLHFEKVLKFLSKLFLRIWPENNCTHDTSVIFFTRVFIFDLPAVYKDHVNRDSCGRCYVDFYRVLVQNERLTVDEWKRVLMQLKLEFRKFQLDLNVHIREQYPAPEGTKIPKIQVSKAMDGNFLEALNMAINFCAGYNMDRNFDRTGKLSFVLSPGTGCFKVDPQLSKLTKQRILDLGFGIDLICFGQQPLHAVPMFQFVNSSESPVEFLVPHWINCSFFRSAHELKRMELGLPIYRTQVYPVFDADRTSELPPSSTTGHASTPCATNVPNSAVVVAEPEHRRPQTRVYRIFYPSPVKHDNINNNNNEVSELTDSIFHQGSPSSDGMQLMRATPLIVHSALNAYGSQSNHAENPVLSALDMVSAMKRVSHGGESDHSPARNTADWDALTVKLPSSLSHSGESELDKLGLRSAIERPQTRPTPSAPIVHGLTSVHERPCDDNNSNNRDFERTDDVLCGSARERGGSTTTTTSDRDEAFSVSSSFDGAVTRNLAGHRSQRPDAIPWILPRNLSFGGSLRNPKARVHTISGPPSHSTVVSIGTGMTSTTTATSSALTPMGAMQKRLAGHSLQWYTHSGLPRANRPGGGRVRKNSMLYPMLHPQNPFEIKLEQATHTMSTNGRRWALVRPTDERDLPVSPHRDLFALRTLEFLHPITPVINLSQVWFAYFSFLRAKLQQPAPGGPYHVIDSLDHHPLGAAAVPRPLDDNRKAATVGKSHGLRATLIPWSINELPPPATLRKRSECLFTEFSQNMQDPVTLQLLHSCIRDTEQPAAPPSSKQTVANEAGHVSSTTRQLLDAVRQATEKPPGCELPNLFTVDQSLAMQRMTTLKNMLKLIAVDWKSVSTPALLPLETDYFPDSSSLKSEGYTLHDYRVVPYGVSCEQWELKNNFDQEPGLAYCRRPMTVREVFYEMVLQRLSYGFQLCRETPTPTPITTTAGDHGGLKLSSPASTASTRLSPPGLTKSVSKATPIRLSTRPIAGQQPRAVRGSTSLANSSHATRRPTALHQSTEADSTVSKVTQSRLLSRHRHPSSTVTTDSIVTTGSNSASGTLGQRTGVANTGPSNAVPILRSFGLGLTLSQPTRTSGTCTSRALSVKTQRSESPTTGINQLNLFNRLGNSSPVVVRLSMGRLLHSISLEEDSITLTNYRFRQDDERIQIEYKYALQVPDADRFIPLKTLFSHEGSLMLNWSYLDNYLCTAGVSDSFVLLPSLKFWRTRFLVLPVFTSETKRLSDLIKERLTNGGPRVACDVYEADFRAMDPAKICEKFTHFIESINRVRRAHPGSRKMARQVTVEKADSAQRSREFSGSSAHVMPAATATGSSNNNNSSSSSSTSTVTTTTQAASGTGLAVTPCTALLAGGKSTAALTHLSSTGATHMQQQVSTGIGADGSAGAMSVTEDNPGTPTATNTLSGPGTGTNPRDVADQSTTPVPPQSHTGGTATCSTQTPAYQVVLMMADPDQGLPFISATSTSAFPERTFFAFDAVTWVMRILSDVDSVEQAVEYLQTLLDNGWIRHTSGNPSHRFIFGSYFYTLLVPDIKALGPQPHSMVASVDTLYPNQADGSEWVVQSTPTTPGCLSSHGVGGAGGGAAATAAGNNILLLGPGMPTQVSQSAANLTTLTAVSGSLSRFTESGHQTAPAPATNTTGLQPIPYPESFLPRATPGPSGWTVDFQTAWMEIAFARNALATVPRRTRLPVASQDTADQISSSDPVLSYSTIRAACGVTDKVGFQEVDSVLRKSCVCDLDYATSGDRAEWAHCVYDANYHPLCAFTIELQWLVASGSRLTELVYQWQHRARNNLHFFPVPCYPFGHPNVRSDTDPLRHPIFVPCRLDLLAVSAVPVAKEQGEDPATTDHDADASPASPSADVATPNSCEWNVAALANQLFSNFPQSQRVHMIRVFQDHLLRRFGFLPATYDSHPGITAAQPTDAPGLGEPVKRWTYVHCSGGMFVMIPIYRSETQSIPCANRSKPASINDSGSTPTLADLSHDSSRDSRNETPVRTCHSRQLSQTLSKDAPNASENSGYVTQCFRDQTTVGYFWSWNHMLPRRWRSYLTGDETFQDAMLADFRAFMNSEDNRLHEALVGFLASVTNQPTLSKDT